MDRLRDVACTAPFDGSAVRGRDPEAVIPKASKKEKAVAEYVSLVSTAIAVSMGSTKLSTYTVRMFESGVRDRLPLVPSLFLLYTRYH